MLQYHVYAVINAFWENIYFYPYAHMIIYSYVSINMYILSAHS